MILHDSSSFMYLTDNDYLVMDFEADPMQTIRPYFPRRQSEPFIGEDLPTITPVAEPPPLLEPSPPKLVKPRKLMLPSRNASRPASMFREDSSEDYSDLAPVNEANFARKVDLMKVEYISCLFVLFFIRA